MGPAPGVAVLHGVVEQLRLPTDLLQQLALQGLLRCFTRIQMAPEQAPTAWGHDAGNVVAQLHQPAAITFQHGKGNLYGLVIYFSHGNS